MFITRIRDLPCRSGDRAAIVCNECNAVVRRVPTNELKKTFTEMEVSLEVATEKCSHCGSVNILSSRFGLFRQSYAQDSVAFPFAERLDNLRARFADVKQ